MKDFPKIDISFRNLYHILMGQVRAKLLLTAIEFKVFNYLTEAKPAIEVARLIGGDPGNTRFFLGGLAACGILEKKKGYPPGFAHGPTGYGSCPQVRVLYKIRLTA